VVDPDGTVELREVHDGNTRVVQQVTAASTPSGWLRVTLTAQADRAEVQVQRVDTGHYLTPAGQWQSAQAEVIRATGLARPAADTALAGVGRLSGPYGTAFVDDFTAAPAPNLDIPRKYSHIRIAQLAYSGTPIDEFTRNLFRDSIDLTVTNPALMAALDQASPDTPQLIYSNVSNLYLSLLTDWLAFADRTGADREAAFYHVAQPTPFQGGSPSSQPVTWFWGVHRGGVGGRQFTNLTANARGGGNGTGVTFGSTGEAVMIGFPERFREINIALNQPASPGWNVVWEFATAVDSKGAPIGWRPFPFLRDWTAGMRQSGRLEFDPPPAWVPATLPGTTASLYYVRARTVAGTSAQAPVAGTILGRDYVNANGQAKGVIPAFDFTADKNGDGYLNDAEYARRRPGFDARFVYESRLFYPFYGQMRFAVNPTSDAVKQWAAEFHLKLLQQNPVADGVFLDNSNGKPPLGGASVLESTANYSQIAGEMVQAVRNAIAPKLVMSNTAGARAEANPIAGASTLAFEEFLIRPMQAHWRQVLDAAELVTQRLNAADPSPYVVLDSLPAGGSTTDPRTQMATLAYYYLLADPDKTFLMFYGGHGPAIPWTQKWVPAAAIDVGRPTGEMNVFASGTDPQNDQLIYRVYGRTYQNALMLYKPRSYTLGRGTGTLDDATATTHSLGGNYRVLNADGTLGPVVTSITLRNGEGVVLMRA
jgi:hypothetical protein